jgi:geranylgeranyl pyrophosphate synthase
MQNFTLVHDDIADGDTLRRSQESIWKQFGVPHGINIGDMFVPLVALSILRAPYSDRVKLQLLQTVADFGLEMAVGQALDINLRSNDSPRVDDYLTCTRKKTGAFLAIATVGGAIVGGASDAQKRLLRDFALLAGIAFQIKDDIIDLDGFKGRQRGSDILEGKRTLLVIHASRNASPIQRRRLFGILNKPRHLNSNADVEWVFDLYRRTGAAEYAQRTAIGLVDEAAESIAELPESPAKYRLLRLATYLSRRSH